MVISISAETIDRIEALINRLARSGNRCWERANEADERGDDATARLYRKQSYAYDKGDAICASILDELGIKYKYVYNEKEDVDLISIQYPE